MYLDNKILCVNFNAVGHLDLGQTCFSVGSADVTPSHPPVNAFFCPIRVSCIKQVPCSQYSQHSSRCFCFFCIQQQNCIFESFQCHALNFTISVAITETVCACELQSFMLPAPFHFDPYLGPWISSKNFESPDTQTYVLWGEIFHLLTSELVNYPHLTS